MMETFISQYGKRALAHIRRVLDVFAGYKALDFMFKRAKAIALKTNWQERQFTRPKVTRQGAVHGGAA